MSREKANEQINSQMTQGNKKNKGVIIAIFAIVVAILVAVVLYLVLGKESEPVEDKKTNLVVTEENLDEVLAALSEEDRIPVGSYEASMNSEWRFKNGEALSENAYVENTVRNQNTVFFTVALKDDGRVIYKSPYLKPGSTLTGIKLDTALDAGVYDTVLTYHLVDEQNQEVSTVKLSVVITIEQ